MFVHTVHCFTGDSLLEPDGLRKLFISRLLDCRVASACSEKLDTIEKKEE